MAPRICGNVLSYIRPRWLQIHHAFLHCGDAHSGSEMGHKLPPTFVNVAAELASTPDAKARNRRAGF
jgi:hypothetical protein